MRQADKPTAQARASFFLPEGRALNRLRPLRGERGSTLVEFALSFAFLLSMLFGIAGFGHALFVYHFVSEAARDATRWAIVNGSTCATDASCSAPASTTDIDTYVKSLVPQSINPSQISTNVTYPIQSDGPAICSTTDNAPGCTVEVKVNYTYNFIFPLLPTSPLTLSSTSEMVIAH